MNNNTYQELLVTQLSLYFKHFTCYTCPYSYSTLNSCDSELFPNLLIKSSKVLPVQIQTIELDNEELGFDLEMKTKLVHPVRIYRAGSFPYHLNKKYIPGKWG